MQNAQEKTIQRHDFRIYSNSQSTEIICCAKCSLQISEKDLKNGTFSKDECPGRKQRPGNREHR